MAQRAPELPQVPEQEEESSQSLQSNAYPSVSYPSMNSDNFKSENVKEVAEQEATTSSAEPPSPKSPKRTESSVTIPVTTVTPPPVAITLHDQRLKNMAPMPLDEAQMRPTGSNHLLQKDSLSSENLMGTSPSQQSYSLGDVENSFTPFSIGPLSPPMGREGSLSTRQEERASSGGSSFDGRTSIHVTESLVRRISNEVREAIASQSSNLAERIAAELREHLGGKRLILNKYAQHRRSDPTDANDARMDAKASLPGRLGRDLEPTSPKTRTLSSAPSPSSPSSPMARCADAAALGPAVTDTANGKGGKINEPNSKGELEIGASSSVKGALRGDRADRRGSFPEAQMRPVGSQQMVPKDSAASSELLGATAYSSELAPTMFPTMSSKRSIQGDMELLVPGYFEMSSLSSEKRAVSRQASVSRQLSGCPTLKGANSYSMKPAASAVPAVKALEAALAHGLLEDERCVGKMMSTRKSRMTTSMSGASRNSKGTEYSSNSQPSNAHVLWLDENLISPVAEVIPTGSLNKGEGGTQSTVGGGSSTPSAKLGAGNSDNFLSPVTRMASSMLVHLSSTIRSSKRSMRSARGQRTNELARISHGQRAATSESLSSSQGSESSEYEDNRPLEPTTTHQAYFLNFCGILPWGQVSNEEEESALCQSASTWYQWFVLLLASAALSACLEATLSAREHRSTGEGSTCYGEACLRLGLLSDISLAFGSIAGLVAIKTHTRSAQLQECILLIMSYSRREGFFDVLRQGLRWDLARTLGVLICAVLVRVQTSGALEAIGKGTLDLVGLLQILASTVYFGVLMGLTCCVLQVCRALTLIVDYFCCSTVGKPDLDGTVHAWNILQAILRKASECVECCFFVLQTTTLGVVLLGVVDVVQNRNGPSEWFFTLIPGLLVTAGIAQIFFSAASVTDKCAHVPSLVNSLHFGEDIDMERQYVVEYIIHSAAGFYVFEVRLTQAMALKFTYFVGVAALSATTIMGI